MHICSVVFWLAQITQSTQIIYSINDFWILIVFVSILTFLKQFNLFSSIFIKLKILQSKTIKFWHNNDQFAFWQSIDQYRKSDQQFEKKFYFGSNRCKIWNFHIIIQTHDWPRKKRHKKNNVVLQHNKIAIFSMNIVMKNWDSSKTC